MVYDNADIMTTGVREDGTNESCSIAINLDIPTAGNWKNLNVQHPPHTGSPSDREFPSVARCSIASAPGVGYSNGSVCRDATLFRTAKFEFGEVAIADGISLRLNKPMIRISARLVSRS